MGVLVISCRAIAENKSSPRCRLIVNVITAQFALYMANKQMQDMGTNTEIMLEKTVEFTPVPTPAATRKEEKAFYFRDVC